jgi:PEP-CTERM motif
MKRLSIFIIALLALGLGNVAMGFSWTAGYYNHGPSPFDANNNASPISYPYGVGYLPSPGSINEGGEKFDLEGLFVAFDANYLYVALANSFGMSATSLSWGSTFYQGDIFFGYGGEKNTYAIDVSTGNFVSVDLWTYIERKPGSYYANSAICNRVGAYNVVFGDILGGANQSLTFWDGLESAPMTPDPTGGDTYVFEWKIDRGLLGWDGASDIFFHTTLGCGNDLIEYTYTGIPEPSTMILLGLGLFGAGLFARRK